MSHAKRAGSGCEPHWVPRGAVWGASATREGVQVWRDVGAETARFRDLYGVVWGYGFGTVWSMGSAQCGVPVRRSVGYRHCLAGLGTLPCEAQVHGVVPL